MRLDLTTDLIPPLYLGVVATKRGALGSHSTTVANFTYFYTIVCKQMIVDKIFQLRQKSMEH